MEIKTEQQAKWFPPKEESEEVISARENDMLRTVAATICARIQCACKIGLDGDSFPIPFPPTSMIRAHTLCKFMKELLGYLPTNPAAESYTFNLFMTSPKFHLLTNENIDSVARDSIRVPGYHRAQQYTLQLVKKDKQ